MNADRLLAFYERSADAPDAIVRFRRFILDLAVRGKLVGQDPNDEPASELLKRIAAEKTRLVRAGQIRKQKAFPFLESPPFYVPENWRWARIREVTSDRGQKVPDAVFTYIDVTAIDKENGLIIGPRVLAPSEAPSRARKIIQRGDVIYSCVRPYLLNIAVIEDDYEPAPIASTAFAILNGHGFVLPRYLWITLRSPFMVACVEENQRGQAYPAINDADFAVLPLPLPPLAEQHRIVAKVDELMALCDQLEAARAEREATRDRFATASLARLNTPDPDPSVFQGHATFALDNLIPLTTRLDQIKALRQTILNLAVRGKLVEQDPNDEPASELLKRIAAEKVGLIKNRKIRKKTPLPPIEQADEPFLVPPRWGWSPLGNLFHLVTDGAHHTPRYIDRGVPFLSVKDVSSGTINFTNVRQISEDQHTKLRKRCCPEKGDILLTKVGTTGIAVPIKTERPFSIFVSVALLKFSAANLAQDYLCHLINSPFVRQQSKDNTQGIGNQNLVLRLINGFALPIPPLAEQHRIVTKVDELMALCDRLEANLTTGNNTRCRLRDALLHEVLSPAADRESAV